MPQSKKKTAVKTGKSGSSGGKKKPVAKPVGTTARKPAAASKAAGAKKQAGKKASVKLESKTTSKTTSKKVTTRKAPGKTSNPKASPAGKSRVRASAAADKRETGAVAGKTGKPKTGKASGTGSNKKIPEHPNPVKEPDTVRSSQATSSPPTPRQAPKPAAGTREPSRKRNQDSELASSIQQGLAKQGQKKRGWRDIEALTERARLKNLLSDIWHEDIDLDSDIFGETDQFSSYYTDKEEEIEVDDDDDEEWEEFEEDES